MRSVENLAGKVFGTREVMYRVKDMQDSSGKKRSAWRVRCKLCGEIRDMRTWQIKRCTNCHCTLRGKRYVKEKLRKRPPKDSCPYNAGVECSGGDCEKCGWKT